MPRDKERKAARDKARREANKEREAARRRAWSEANKEREAARHKAYRDANKDRRLEYQKAWNEGNKERRAAYIKEWYESNKEIKSDASKKRREALSTSYVANTLGIKTAECPPELIELKREQLAMLRLVKQLNEVIKEKINAE